LAFALWRPGFLNFTFTITATATLTNADGTKLCTFSKTVLRDAFGVADTTRVSCINTLGTVSAKRGELATYTFQGVISGSNKQHDVALFVLLCTMIVSLLLF
jgi:hypothetical protein